MSNIQAARLGLPEVNLYRHTAGVLNERSLEWDCQLTQN